jgi:hypothetical protein
MLVVLKQYCQKCNFPKRPLCGPNIMSLNWRSVSGAWYESSDSVTAVTLSLMWASLVNFVQIALSSHKHFSFCHSWTDGTRGVEERDFSIKLEFCGIYSCGRKIGRVRRKGLVTVLLMWPWGPYKTEKHKEGNSKYSGTIEVIGERLFYIYYVCLFVECIYLFLFIYLHTHTHTHVRLSNVHRGVQSTDFLCTWLHCILTAMGVFLFTLFSYLWISNTSPKNNNRRYLLWYHVVQCC